MLLTYASFLFLLCTCLLWTSPTLSMSAGTRGKNYAGTEVAQPSTISPPAFEKGPTPNDTVLGEDEEKPVDQGVEIVDLPALALSTGLNSNSSQFINTSDIQFVRRAEPLTLKLYFTHGQKAFGNISLTAVSVDPGKLRQALQDMDAFAEQMNQTEPDAQLSHFNVSSQGLTMVLASVPADPLNKMTWTHVQDVAQALLDDTNRKPGFNTSYVGLVMVGETNPKPYAILTVLPDFADVYVNEADLAQNTTQSPDPDRSDAGYPQEDPAAAYRPGGGRKPLGLVAQPGEVLVSSGVGRYPAKYMTYVASAFTISAKVAYEMISAAMDKVDQDETGRSYSELVLATKDVTLILKVSKTTGSIDWFQALDMLHAMRTAIARSEGFRWDTNHVQATQLVKVVIGSVWAAGNVVATWTIGDDSIFPPACPKPNLFQQFMNCFVHPAVKDEL